MKNLTAIILLLVVATSCNKENLTNEEILIGKWKSDAGVANQYHIHKYKEDGVRCSQYFYPDSPNVTEEEVCGTSYVLDEPRLIITTLGSNNTDTCSIQIVDNKNIVVNDIHYSRIQ